MTLSEGVEVELKRCRPKKGDVLALVIKSDDVDERIVARVWAKVKQELPDAKVFVFGVGVKDDIFLYALTDEQGAVVERLARALKERDDWKRRAQQHGCDVDRGDPDCG